MLEKEYIPFFDYFNPFVDYFNPFVDLFWMSAQKSISLSSKILMRNAR